MAPARKGMPSTKLGQRPGPRAASGAGDRRVGVPQGTVQGVVPFRTKFSFV